MSRKSAAILSQFARECGLYGTTGKAESVSEQRDSVKSCQVASYALTNPRVIPIDANAAILLYDAEQHAVCGDQPVHPFNIRSSEVPVANALSTPQKLGTEKLAANQHPNSSPWSGGCRY
ncbi:MAG: hypothetical protein ACRD4A_04435 [Candidatus Acidiferrales bacterium]